MAVVGALVAVAVLTVPAATPSVSVASWGSTALVSPKQVDVGLVKGASSWTHFGTPFFAVTVQLGGLSTPTLQTLGAYFNSTPITTFRIGGGGEGYDPTTQTYYKAPAAGGTFTANHNEVLNYTWIKSWCYSRVPHCDWLAYLPGEENNTQAALHAAQYFHNVLHFVPTYWEFDNEPNHWTHYGKNRSQWSTSDASTPSALGYAVMVRNYIAAISAVFPSDKFIGVEIGCDCFANYITATARLNPHVAAMAYHTYPGPKLTASTLNEFYGSLSSRQNLSATTSHFLANIQAQCSQCGNISLQVGEYQTGPPVNHSAYALRYPGAAWITASVVEALETNLSMFTEFDDSWLIDSATGAVLPEGVAYQQILKNLTMGSDTALHLNTSKVGSVYAILIKNGTRQSLLLVNLNTTVTLNLKLTSTIFPIGGAGNEWVWTSLLASPTHVHVTLIGSTFVVAPQEVLLLNNF